MLCRVTVISIATGRPSIEAESHSLAQLAPSKYMNCRPTTSSAINSAAPSELFAPFCDS